MHGETAMANDLRHTGIWRRSRWRKAMWGFAAALLLLPAVAMQFTDEVSWDETDFIVIGLMLAAACGAIEAGMRMSGNLAYRAGAAVGVVGAFGLLWVNMAVGIIGSEDNLANLMYPGVLIIGIVGAVLARFRARGLVFTMLAMAAAQVLVPVIAVAAGWVGVATPTVRVIGITLFFMGPWLLSAALFRLAQADAPPRAAAG
jgi:hypothetical protein